MAAGSDGQAPTGKLLEAAVEAMSRQIQNIAPLSGHGTGCVKHVGVKGRWVSRMSWLSRLNDEMENLWEKHVWESNQVPIW